MTAIILKVLRWLFTIALVIITLFLGKFYLAKQDSIPKHIHEALRNALGDEKEAYERLDSIRVVQVEEEREKIDDLQAKTSFYKSILRTHKSTQLTKDAIIRRIRKDSTFLATELQRLRDSIPDPDEVYYLSQGPSLEKEIAYQAQIINTHEATEVRFKRQDSIQEERIQGLTDRVSRLQRFPNLYIREKCKRSGVPWTRIRFGVSGECLTQVRASLQGK
ncbi:MAG: hypothetical protein OXB93_00960 [Cytophagales bacterium]|nr:hypothetical protein [Cytophagales bacterium]